MDQYYTTGEFARMAHVTIRTIRYYDKKGLLKPSFINESGYRMYSDEDFLKLQKILSLKYLGFSLNEIGNMTIHDTSADILKSLKMQIGLVHKKMENLEQMEKALQNTTQILEETNQIDWTGILNLIHLTDMEKMLVEQYKNGENLNIRMSDLSDGMIRDAAENWEKKRHSVLISGHWTARSFRFRMRNTTGLLQIMFCSMSRICPAVCRKSAVCFQMTACSTAVRMEKAI